MGSSTRRRGPSASCDLPARRAAELGCPCHPELVARRSLLDALARGERRDALLAFFEGADETLLRAFSSRILAPLYC